MGYVKGCDITILSPSLLRKIENGKIIIAEEIKDKLSVEKLRDLIDEALKDFVDYSGAVKHGVNSGRIFILLKKIEKQKTLLGISVVKRVPGMPSGKTGVAAWFESSPDSYVAEEKIFAPGYEAEEQYFDESILQNFKDYIGLGQIKEAEYFDKVVIMKKEINFLGSTITRAAYFVLMLVIWSMVFKNIGLGIVFAFLFSSSFIMITSRSGAEKTEKKEEA